MAVPGLFSRPAASAEQAYLTFGLPAGDYDTAVLDALPGKKPLITLIVRRTTRPRFPISLHRSPRTMPSLSAITSLTPRANRFAELEAAGWRRGRREPVRADDGRPAERVRAGRDHRG